MEPYQPEHHQQCQPHEHIWEFQCEDEVNGEVMLVLACDLCGLERLA